MNANIATVWKQVTPALEQELVDFWREQQAIPNEDEARKRADQAICVLRDGGGALAGVATAIVKVLPRLRQPMYYYRIYIARSQRGREAFLPMVRESRQILQDFNRGLERPESLGLLFEIENGKLGKAYPHAYEPTFDATFIGYSPRGKGLYVSYFADAMLQTPAQIAVAPGHGGVRRNTNQSLPAQQQSG